MGRESGMNTRFYPQPIRPVVNAVLYARHCLVRPLLAVSWIISHYPVVLYSSSDWPHFMSCQFVSKLEAELRAVPWDVVVIDEAHKLRNAHRASNRTGHVRRHSCSAHPRSGQPARAAGTLEA